MAYRFRKDAYEGVDNYAVASGVTVGDMMQWDLGSRRATRMTTNSGAIFLGVSEGTNPAAGLGSARVPLTGNMVRIRSTGVHAMKATAFEVYVHLDPLFVGADAQTVTKIGAGRMVARAWVPDGTAVSGTSVDVMIYGSMTNNSVTPTSFGEAM